ncbi:MAG: hypothetical protein K5696_11195 [Lachnospiraceae bacterium]|nr:hypothetical protein [Lachnospiraceae bacterium]
MQWIEYCLCFGKFVPVLQVIEGVITAWIPGMMILTGIW